MWMGDLCFIYHGRSDKQTKRKSRKKRIVSNIEKYHEKMLNIALNAAKTIGAIKHQTCLNTVLSFMNG